MRFGGFLSLLLHLAILLLILFGLPDLFKQEEVMAPVAVQLATLADITAQPKPSVTPPKPVVKQETPPPPAPTPPAPPTPPPAPQPAEQIPTPPEPAPPPPPPPLPPEPTPPAPQPVEQTPPAPVPIPDQQPTPPPPQEAKIETPPAPLLRPANLKPPKPTKPAPPPQDFNSLLKNVEKLKAASTDTQPPQPDAPPQPDTSASDLSAPQMTSSELDAVKSQMRGCWYLDPGKKGADEMVVDVRVTLGQDGTVQTANVVDMARMALDGYYRAAAEAAVRAVKKCSPLHMPVGKYDTWKVTTFHFNPGGMLSQ
jgi:hypothetical protein